MFWHPNPGQIMTNFYVRAIFAIENYNDNKYDELCFSIKQMN